MYSVLPIPQTQMSSDKKGLCDFLSSLELEYISSLGNYHIVNGVETVELLRYLHLGNEIRNEFSFSMATMKCIEKFNFMYFLPYVHFSFGIPNSMSCHPSPTHGPS